MAMLNRPIHTPPWLRVEIAEDPVLGQHLNIGVRCADGWAHLVSMPINVVNFDDVVHREKVIAYRHAHEFITNQLAIETLEKT
jgi:hypothetical protein